MIEQRFHFYISSEMSLFDNCCLNTTAKYNIKNQKVKKELINKHLFLFALYILNTRFGKEIIYTYIILIHHLGMGPVIQRSYANLSWKCPNIMTIRQCILIKIWIFDLFHQWTKQKSGN